MDIHGQFENMLEDLYNCIENIKVENENPTRPPYIRMSEWDMFESFLQRLVNKDDRFKVAIAQLLSNKESLYEKTIDFFDDIKLDNNTEFKELKFVEKGLTVIIKDENVE